MKANHVLVSSVVLAMLLPGVAAANILSGGNWDFETPNIPGASNAVVTYTVGSTIADWVVIGSGSVNLHHVNENTIWPGNSSQFLDLTGLTGSAGIAWSNIPWLNRPMGYDNDIYSVYPALGALYAQDNITLSGMILNFGLRLDYWFPGEYVDNVARDTSTALIVPPAQRAQYLEDTWTVFGHQMKARISPRLGISHPVSDNQTLFFSYGYFSKFPRPQFVYSKLERTSVRSSLPVGNPNLGPETTVAYELGIRNQFSGNDVLTVTAYYKEIFDYITEKTVRRLNTYGGAQYYTTYLNTDYARIRGIEAEYKKRIGNWFRAFDHYTIKVNATWSALTKRLSGFISRWERKNPLPAWRDGHCGGRTNTSYRQKLVTA